MNVNRITHIVILTGVSNLLNNDDPIQNRESGRPWAATATNPPSSGLFRQSRLESLLIIQRCAMLQRRLSLMSGNNNSNSNNTSDANTSSLPERGRHPDFSTFFNSRSDGLSSMSGASAAAGSPSSAMRQYLNVPVIRVNNLPVNDSWGPPGPPLSRRRRPSRSRYLNTPPSSSVMFQGLANDMLYGSSSRGDRSSAAGSNATGSNAPYNDSGDHSASSFYLNSIRSQV